MASCGGASKAGRIGNPSYVVAPALAMLALLTPWAGIQGDLSAAETDPNNCTWTLLLEDVLPPQPPRLKPVTLRVYPYRAEGKWVHAVGSSPGWNRAAHTVHIERLEYAGGQLQGKLRIVLYPDATIPADQKPIELAVDISGRVDPKLGLSDDSIDGTYRGTCGAKEISGKLRGHLATPPWQPLDLCQYQIIMYTALADGATAAERRIRVTFHIRGGKVIGASWTKLDSQGRPGEPVDFNPQNIKVSMTSLNGEFELDHGPAKYRFRLDGKRVDNLIGGEFEAAATVLGRHEIVRKGMFRGDALPPPK